MKHLLSYILLPHFYLFTRVQAYWLHSSCTNHPNAAFIDQQVIAAFQLAADTGLKFVVWDDVNGMDADEKRLFDLLLGGGQNNFDEASRTFLGIDRAIPSIRDRETSEPQRGMKIYCNLDWMQLVKPADKTIEEIWRAGKKNWGIRWDRVKLGTICKYAHALTIWSEAVLELDGASVIVLCPWFVNVMNRQRDPRPTTVLGRIGDLLVTGLQHTPVLHGRKEIDLYAWPYTTILHEFMHTPQGRYKDDVAGDIRSYQWANVKRIDPAQKINNADNLMYFALAMELKSRQPPLIVQDDGSVT